MKAVERINFAVVAVTAALFLSIAVFVAISTSRMMVSEARSTVENVVKAAVGRIDRQMASVESAVENSAWIVGERLADPDYMFRITGELVQNNPFIVGSTIAFEPNFFPSKGYYYSAFSYKDEKGKIKRIQQGGETFKYHGMDWYRIPKETKKISPRPTTENNAIRRTRRRAPCRMLASGQTSSTVQPLLAFPAIFTVSVAVAASSGAATSGLPSCEKRTA